MCKYYKRKKKLIDDSSFEEFLNSNSLLNQNFQNSLSLNSSASVKNSVAEQNVNYMKIEPQQNLISGINVNLASAKSVWGAVVMLLRKNGLMALFTACGDIREIKLEGHELVINIREEFLYNILTKEENLYKITTLLKQIKSDLELKFVLINKKDNNAEINLKRLTEVFGNTLEIKN